MIVTKIYYADCRPMIEQSTKTQTKIEILPQDCLTFLQHCPTDKSILLMDMANGEVPGGFDYKGVSSLMGQEEKLCLSSNLKTFLKTCDYPLNSHNELLICKQVQFANRQCDVAVTVAPNHKANLVFNNKTHYDKMSLTEIDEVRRQIRMFLKASENYDIAIASALGCRAFRCDPFVVSKIFELELKNFNVKHIVFCIYRENYDLDNFSVFSETILNDRVYPQLNWYKEYFVPKKLQ